MAAKSALRLMILAGTVQSVSCRAFLQGNSAFGEVASIAEVQQSLLVELQVAVRGADGSSGALRLARLEDDLKPMYLALPKNGHGRLGHAAVRYALHRFFVQKHGWFVKGLEQVAQWRGDPAQTAGMLKRRVPGYIQDMLEDQLGGQGLGLQELAVLAAALEHLVHDEVIQKLRGVYELLELPLTGPVSEELVDRAIGVYMMLYIQGGNASATTAQKLLAKQERLVKKDAGWRDTAQWMQDTRLNVAFQERHRRNAFAEPGLDFTGAARVVEEIGEGFGRWQDRECRGLKGVLTDLDRHGAGRVPLADFYGATLDKSVPVPFQFTERPGFLRQLGALDESGQASVMIPNYVNARTNCLTTTSFYTVCCIDECEALLGHLEREVGEPTAAPDRIASLVARLPSDTVDAPRNLTASLLVRLEEVAARHEGAVPLHSRLFAQWMHHAYPRECGFPHASGAEGAPVSPGEWMVQSERLATKEQMLQLVEEAAQESEDRDWQDELLWTEEQELFATDAEQRSWKGTLREGVRCMALLAVVCSAAASVAGMWRSSLGGLQQRPGKDLCKCV